MKQYALALTSLCLVAFACNKVEFDDDGGSTSGSSSGIIAPQSLRGTGAGTLAYPYTIGDVIAGKAVTDEPVWVIGYVVGATQRSMSNAEFLSSTTIESSILLSHDSTSHDVKDCIPVELKSATARKNYAIPGNSKGYRKCLMLRGNVRTYLYNIGLRDVDAGQWLYDFDISSIVNSGREEWEDTLHVTL